MQELRSVRTRNRTPYLLFPFTQRERLEAHISPLAKAGLVAPQLKFAAMIQFQLLVSSSLKNTAYPGENYQALGLLSHQAP